MAKNNQKKLKTKQKIYQSLIQLSKHKSIKDVSVSEICRTASINRSTFYLHYQDISDLIMEFRQTNIYDFIDSIKEKKKHPNTINLTKSPTVFLDYKDLVQTIHYAQKEKDIVRMLLGKNGDPDFVDELKSAIRNLISYLLKDHYPQLKKNFQMYQMITLKLFYLIPLQKL